mgnify:CR=1 FL=1
MPQGERVGATPDGRRAKAPLADNASPSPGADRHGPTAVLKSAAKLDYVLASNGTILNLKLHPSALTGEAQLDRFAALIRSFIDLKGMQVQFNILTADVEAIGRLMHFMQMKSGRLPYDARWMAIKLIEDDKIVKERLVAAAPETGSHILQAAQSLHTHLTQRFDEDPQIVMTDERYGFIAGIIREVQSATIQQRVDISRNIDLVLTHRLFGFPIFVFFIWAMFQLTFTLGEYPVQWLGAGVDGLSEAVGAALPEGVLRSLLVDGVVAGVGSVIKFLPNILILFFCIALFEDTGYMARSAFLMDRIMHLIGLHGKSFIPMLMGFGCNVPAIMAARTLESEKDRILTILITPFMSCSAKLPVYVVLAGAFFGARAGTVIFGIYLLGVVLSILTGRIFRSTLLKGADAPFVMELPPYRMPMAKSLLIHMWDRSKLFLLRMGQVILVGSIAIWLLSNFPRDVAPSRDYATETGRITAKADSQKATADGSERRRIEEQAEQAVSDLRREQKAEQTQQSYIGRIGRFIAPVFTATFRLSWRSAVIFSSPMRWRQRVRDERSKGNSWRNTCSPQKCW